MNFRIQAKFFRYSLVLVLQFVGGLFLRDNQIVAGYLMSVMAIVAALFPEER